MFYSILHLMPHIIEYIISVFKFFSLISKACSLNNKFLFGMLYINLLSLVWFWSRIWGFYKFWSFKSWSFWYSCLGRLILILHLKCFLFRFMWFFLFLFLGIIILILFHVLNCLYCYYYEKVILLLKFETWCVSS